MSRPDPFKTFDWDFTDATEDGARSAALDARPEATLVLTKVVEADSLVHFALWSTLGPEHPVGQLWLETQTDLLATIYLAYGGFFRQALLVLRSWYELALQGVYFSNHYGQRTARYEQWRRGERMSPRRIEDLAIALAARSDRSLGVEEGTIRNRIVPLYDALCEHAHGRGLDLHDLQDGRDNVPRFLAKSFDLWYAKLLEVFDVICFLYRLFFVPSIAQYLTAAQREHARAQELSVDLSSRLPEFCSLIRESVTSACAVG